MTKTRKAIKSDFTYEQSGDLVAIFANGKVIAHAADETEALLMIQDIVSRGTVEVEVTGREQMPEAKLNGELLQGEGYASYHRVKGQWLSVNWSPYEVRWDVREPAKIAKLDAMVAPEYVGFPGVKITGEMFYYVSSHRATAGWESCYVTQMLANGNHRTVKKGITLDELHTFVVEKMDRGAKFVAQQDNYQVARVIHGLRDFFEQSKNRERNLANAQTKKQQHTNEAKASEGAVVMKKTAKNNAKNNAKAAAKIVKEMPTCLCGCGKQTKGGKFCMGHDARLVSIIKNGVTGKSAYGYAKHLVHAIGDGKMTLAVAKAGFLSKFPTKAS